MEKQILDYKVKELFGLSRRFKIIAITMLIDSIADDKAYETKASIETDSEAIKLEKEEKEYKLACSKCKLGVTKQCTDCNIYDNCK